MQLLVYINYKKQNHYVHTFCATFISRFIILAAHHAFKIINLCPFYQFDRFCYLNEDRSIQEAFRELGHIHVCELMSRSSCIDHTLYRYALEPALKVKRLSNFQIIGICLVLINFDLKILPGSTSVKVRVTCHIKLPVCCCTLAQHRAQ